MTRRPIDARIRVGPESAAGTGEILRDAYAAWVSGVTIVAARTDTGIAGLTVSAFTPVSLDPPLLLVCLQGDTPLLTAIRDVRRFTVNVLSAGQRRAANQFSDRFPVGDTTFREGDEAELEDALASFNCRLEAEYEGGDHRIIVGRVADVRVGTGEAALIHYRRRYSGVD